MGVPSDAIPREIGMCQETSLTIERAAVTMETLGEEEHDVCKLLHLVPYVTVGDFPETEWGDALPHLEGLPDGLVGLVLADLRGVVLYTEECVIVCGSERGKGGRVETGFGVIPSSWENHFSHIIVTSLVFGSLGTNVKLSRKFKSWVLFHHVLLQLQHIHFDVC